MLHNLSNWVYFGVNGQYYLVATKLNWPFGSALTIVFFTLSKDSAAASFISQLDLVLFSWTYEFLIYMEKEN